MALLSGKLSYLKAFDETHLNSPDYLRWVRDYDVVKTLNKTDYLRPVSFEEVKQYCTQLMQSLDDMFFALYEIESHSFIGTLRVSKINWPSKVADIGIMIGNREFWGKGLATDAISAISRYLFSKCGFRKLTAGYMAVNPAMGEAFLKVGFKSEGVLREQNYFEGKYVDHILIGCFVHEFLDVNQI
jgi:ribosomal-protein-alanine N-acetyltransferase